MEMQLARTLRDLSHVVVTVGILEVELRALVGTCFLICYVVLYEYFYW